MKNIAIALLLMLPNATNAADAFVPLSQSEGLLIQAPGASSVTVSRMPIQSIGTVTVTPGPITPGPIVPSDTLAASLSKAQAAIPAYASKEDHAKAIAVSISFVAPYLTGTANVSAITAILKTMSDASMGDDAEKWSTWWLALDNGTKGMTVAQYKAALPSVTDSLTANMEFQSSEFGGVETYGLDMTKVMELIQFILKYLPMILALFGK